MTKRHYLRPTLAVFCAIFFVLPVLLALVGSLFPLGGTLWLDGFSQSGQAAWRNYRSLFDVVPFGRYFGNSLLVVMLSVPLSLLFAALAGFSLVRMPQPWRRWLVTFAIVTMIVPPSAVWLLRFQAFSQIGLIDSLFALVVPALAGGNSLFVLIYFWAWRQVPVELFEAAEIDGAGFLKTWWQVALPLVHPATAAVTLLAFMLFWGNFIEPVLFIYDPGKYTLPVGLQLLNQLDSANRPLLLAGAVVAMLPPISVFAVAQHWFLQRSMTDG
ncbi:MAG: carbohydrate ABC transporter permease [Anaerolineae bacterium]